MLLPRLLHRSAITSRSLRTRALNKIPAKLVALRSRIREFRGENIYTVPNFLSLSRLALSPAIGYLIANGSYYPALTCFAIAGVTDLVFPKVADVSSMALLRGHLRAKRRELALFWILRQTRH